MQIRKIGIISKPRKTEVREIVPPLIEWLRKREIETFIDKETRTIVESTERSLPRNDMPGQAELLAVLGGDGAVLATARALNRKPVPSRAVTLRGPALSTVTT